MCNCIEKINKMIIDQTGDEKAKLNVVCSMGNDRTITVHIPVTYTARSRKKDGSFSKKNKTYTLFGSYCPFCGKKYDDKDQTK